MLYIAGTDRRVHRWAKYATWIFIVGQIVINLLAFVVFYAQCGKHLDIFWTPSKISMQPEYCMDVRIQTDLGYVQGAFNCVTDAYLTILPAILIDHTKLSMKKKVGLGFLLCLSVLALTAAIVKTYEAKALSEVADYSYDLCDYVIWIAIELNVVIVVSSIPLLRPLLSLFRRKHQRLPDESQRNWSASTQGTIFTKSRSRTRTKAMSSSSQEDMVPHSSQIFCMEEPSGGITVTKEVSVTFQPNDVQFVHAALVGLVQGEIAHPRRTRR